MNTLGVDIGGTKIYVGRYDAALKLEAETTISTAADQPKEVTLAHLLKAIETCKNQATQSIGISWAGFVDTQNGCIIKAPNVPHLDGFPITDFIKQRTGLPTFIENDARAFTYGARLNVAPETKMCLGLIIGTGVGGGIVQNGQIMHGAHGYAGEVGHLVLQQKEVETWLAGPGLKIQLGLKSDLNFSEILPLKKQSLMPQLETNLAVFGQWISALVLSFDPDIIIIGGGTARYFWQHFESEINQSTQAHLKNYPNHFKIHFYNDNNAGAAGAAALCQLQ